MLQTVKKPQGDNAYQAHWLADEIALHSFVSRNVQNRDHVAKFIAAYQVRCGLVLCVY